ncbi:hypothetical protein T07_10101 [Trichinella nelsoni]|uniref:Uncharacterized protein n=1 Tax=Trichinella nelsoni TaxID=6336 RepID=A0A0V0RHL6_9BILA|nr:hypothetical protein T07_10101 [Trichinella nelsoni]
MLIIVPHTTISYIKLKNIILNAEQLNKRSSFYGFIPAAYLRIWNQSVFNIQKKARQNDFPCCQQLKIPAVSQKAKPKKFESCLNILSGVLIAALKLLLNGTSRCSPFMRHSYMLSVLQPLK